MPSKWLEYFFTGKALILKSLVPLNSLLILVSRWALCKIRRSVLTFISVVFLSAYLTVILNTEISSAFSPKLGEKHPVSSQASRPIPDPETPVFVHHTVAQVPPSSLVQQSKDLYLAGKYSEAIRVLQQATEAYKAAGDVLGQAMSLSNLSLTYQQLGQFPDASNAIAASLQLLGSQKPTSEVLQTLAPALNTQASLLLAQGQPENALSTWEKAAATYAQAGDKNGANGALINQAQALQAMGFYKRAQKKLEEVNKNLEASPDSLLKAAEWRSLGNALRLVGDLQESQKVLEQSLEQAKRFQSAQDISDTLFSLGNTLRSQQETEAALSYYQQAAELSPSPLTRTRALLNQLSLLVDTKQDGAALALGPKIAAQLTDLSPSSTSVEARINLAQSLMRLASRGVEEQKGREDSSITNRPSPIPNSQDIAQLLATAVQEAKSLGNPRIEAYALGQMGALYEQNQQLSAANDLTEKALVLSQAVNAPDITYRWQWQLGRLLKAQGDKKGAIAAYSEAVEILKSLRSDLVAINPDVQFSFRESVEPIYRQLVGLLLEAEGNTEPSQENLVQARNVIESLQIAELENFFQEACLQTKPVQVDKVDPTAALIYPIILEDRLEVVLSLPQKPLRHYKTNLSRSEIDDTLDQVKQSLGPLASNQQRLRLFGQLYDWLIRPAASDLASSGVKTLVFVLDGSLRSIPMAALYDGKQYLLEQYSIALSPSLQLLEPRSLQPSNLRVLKGGLSESVQGFAALPAVKFELNEISAEVPGKVLLNEQLTTQNVQAQLNATPFPVVHLATHGLFSSNAKDTFILTWDGRINVKQLDELFRFRNRNQSHPLELLVLSACQTATGDNRAALGLAGVAVRSGARSTLATLWSVKDESTAILMTNFYEELAKPGVTKAEALRRAQLSLLRDRRFQQPIYWAPFVLVGNWL